MEKDKTIWLTDINTYHVATTPYMLTDLGIIKDHCEIFKKVFPKVKLFYAVKAFSDNEVLHAISRYVDGFDAASIQEINDLLKLGVAPQRITFSNPVKPRDAIHEAMTRGVDKFSFQSIDELIKIAELGKKVNVFARVKMDDTQSAVPLSTKYGCAQDEAVELLLRAQKLGLRPVGITFHVGSQQTGLDPWKKALHTSQKLILQAQAAGLEVDTINMGGGFPVQYYAKDPPINTWSLAVNDSLHPDLNYIAEPGRYLVADSSVIVSSIIGIEKRQNKTWLFLDVGLFQAFVGTLRFDPFPNPPFLISKKELPHDKKYVLTGPSCDSHDIITFDAHLPKDLKIGDRIAFPKTGAYTVVYGADFNGFKVPPRFFISLDESKEK